MALTTSYTRKDFNNFQQEQSPSPREVNTIGARLKFYAETKGSQNALVFASPDRVYPRETVTYKQLYDRSSTMARTLVNLGIIPGEIVAVNIRPCPEWLYIAFGATLAGAMVVGISFTYSDGSDLVALMDKLKTCALLALDTGTDGTNWEILERLLDDYNEDGYVRSEKMPYLRYVISHAFPEDTCPSIRSVTQIVDTDLKHVDLPSLQEDDTVFLFQTSGSTGVPKLVTHSHKTMLDCFAATDIFDDITFNDRPFLWSGGFPYQVFKGKTRVTVSGFGQQSSYDMQRVVEIITEERCKYVFALPPQLSRLIEIHDTLPTDWPVEIIVTGGQPIKKHLVKAIGKSCNELYIVYGGTEITLLCGKKIREEESFLDYDCGRLTNITGLEAKIVDDEGQTVPVNTKGEIYIKSPSMFKGYHNDPEKTAEVFDADGWYKSDDIARMTEAGEFFVYGRKSNMILSGGMNVSPEIIEDVLKRFPGVDNVIIVPVSDPVFYQVLCACVVLGKSQVVSEDDLKSFCENFHNDRPGLFTVLPKFYLFFDEFPQTNNGKTAHTVMQKMAEKKFGRK